MRMCVTHAVVALGLVLSCLAADALAQNRRMPEPPAPFWSSWRSPIFERDLKEAQAKSKPKAKATAMRAAPVAPKKREPMPEETVAKAVLEMGSGEQAKIDTTSFESEFSSVRSSRRNTIVKRESADKISLSPAEQFIASPPTATLFTPHWTPKFGSQAAYLQEPDNELARPVAVTMAGELISERVTVTRAVAKMDATLNLATVATVAAAR